MDLTSLKDRLVEWLKGGPAGDVVLSSRVRLARNIEGYPFVGRASDQQRARIETLLSGVLSKLPAEPSLQYVRLSGLERLEVELLLERHLISTELAEVQWVRGVAFDRPERASVMVNEEDHLRIQFIRGGLRLAEAYEGADRLDDLIARRLPYAYSPRYGYLTACPTNVGTGMRASVMLHLPGIVMTQEMDKVIKAAHRERLAVRGLYGEGTHGAGDFYQISNQVTLGVSEEDIVSTVASAAGRLVELERAARKNLYDKHAEKFRSRIDHALALLRSASTLSSQEALNFLSQVRMGIEMDMLPDTPPEAVNDLFLLTLPAHLQTMEGRALDSAVRNELRASYVKSRLETS